MYLPHLLNEQQAGEKVHMGKRLGVYCLLTC